MAWKPAKDYLEQKYVMDQLTAASEYVGECIRNQFSDDIATRLHECRDDDAKELGFDSVLEAGFWIWWRAFVKTDAICDGFWLDRHVDVKIYGQTYVVDFVAKPLLQRLIDRPELAVEWPKVGIELDGHAFHEKTLEQVTYRNQRDRALQGAGWRIFHFSFSEFSKHPESVLIEFVEFIRDRELEIWKRREAQTPGDTPNAG